MGEKHRFDGKETYSRQLLCNIVAKKVSIRADKAYNYYGILQFNIESLYLNLKSGLWVAAR